LLTKARGTDEVNCKSTCSSSKRGLTRRAFFAAIRGTGAGCHLTSSEVQISPLLW